MAEKMIGLVFSSMDSETTLELYHGIVEKADQYGYTTQGYVIYPSQNSSEEYNKGEFFMFETIDYKMYDGLILMLNTISNELTKQYILECIRLADIPMIAIDCDIANAYHINTTNYTSVEKMLFHLIDHHHYKKINYISGPSFNEESNQRTRAYLNAMKKRGLSTEGRIFEGSFFVEDGPNALSYFCRDGRELDCDAIVCGNDMAAISTICALSKRNIRVPEDIAVVGFDDVLESIQVDPPLSTITKDNYRIGTLSVEYLHDFWTQKEVPAETTVESTLVLRESCGCSHSQSATSHLNSAFKNNFSFSKLCGVHNRSFIEAGMECDTFEEYLNVIQAFISKLRPAQFSLHIHGDYEKLFELEDYPGVIINSPDGSSSKMINVLTYMNGTFLPMKGTAFPDPGDFNPKEMRLPFENMPTFHFLNSPLHFRDKKIGFVVFANSDFPTMPSLYSSWLNAIDLTINNISSKMTINEFSRLDPLTGLYNRYGLEYYWDRYCALANRTRTNLFILFADLNGLKVINDRYGHEQGDFAIQQFAKTIQKFVGNNSIGIRYGGDEFLILGTAPDSALITSLQTQINDELSAISSHIEADFEISASMGYYLHDNGRPITLDECVQIADTNMYQYKKAYHETKGR